MILPLVSFTLVAGCGAGLRYLAGTLLGTLWATLFVNFLGCLGIGFLFVYLDRYSSMTKTITMGAFLGSLTTFSSFALVCMKMIQNSQWKPFLAYFTGTQILCLGGCYLGFHLAYLWVD